MMRSQSASDSSSSAPVQETHAGLDIGRLQTAFLGRRFIVPADDGLPALQGFRFHLHHRDGNAGVEKVHRDAAAHRAGPNDPDAFDRQRFRRLRHISHLAGLALREESMALCGGLFALQQFDEKLAFVFQALIKGQIDGPLDGREYIRPGPRNRELAGVRSSRNP